MPITLRSRPKCHYCGKAHRPLGKAAKFQCQHCLADNFLDENGEITDVPYEYAGVDASLPALDRPFDAADSIFCSTCLQNQYIYTQKLSDLLPEPDDPRYNEIEATLPVIKERLERDYPQCCARCEPRVRAQLQHATYQARSDHLRRVLQKSRTRRIAGAFGWRSLIVNGTGLVYFASLSLQLLWHAMGSQSSRVVAPDVRLTDCLQTWPASEACSDRVGTIVGPALLMSVFSIWWNPQWQHKLSGREGRLRGLDVFYRSQVVVLALRFLSWVLLRDVPALVPFRPMLHSVFLVMTAVLAAYNLFGVITVDKTPLVDWHQNPAPLLTAGQYVPPPTRLESPPSPQESFLWSGMAGEESPHVDAWRPPTPPADEDAMDWVPSQGSSFQPRPIKQKSIQPSPFYGTLPSLPRAANYSRKLQDHHGPSPAIGIPQGFFDRPHTKDSKIASMDRAVFAQPKFFGSVAASDTGLENIFGKVFSLQDDISATMQKNEPIQLDDASSGMRSNGTTYGHVNGHHLSVCKCYSAIAVATLVILLMFFSAASYWEFFDMAHVSLASIALTSVPGLGVPLKAMSIRTANDIQRFGYLCMETAIAAGLSLAQQPTGSVLLSLWYKSVIGLICWLLIQEICNFCHNDHANVDHTRSVDSVEIMAEAKSRQRETQLSGESPMEIVPRGLDTPQRPSRRRDSGASLASTASINTTSTASGWKTPVNNHRYLDMQPRAAHSTPSNAGGFTTLGLHNMHIGNSVAGPRPRHRS